jgi:hypothetical protein
VNASADTQERWRQFYENNERGPEVDLIQKADSRAFWQTCFVIASSAFVGGLMAVFYKVLSAN